MFCSNKYFFSLINLYRQHCECNKLLWIVLEKKKVKWPQDLQF